MANSYEEILRIVVKTQGESDVGRFAKTLLDLGKTGELTEAQLEGLAQEVKQFSDELDRLADADAGIQSLQKLEGGLLDIEEKLDLASKTAYQLKLQLGSVEKPTRQMQKAFEDASKEVRTLEGLQRKQRDTIAALDAQLKAAGVDTRKLGDEQARLRGETERTLGAARAQTEAAKAHAAAERELRDRLQARHAVIRAQIAQSREASQAAEKLAAETARAATETRKFAAEAGGATQKFSLLETSLGKISALAAAVATSLGTMRFASGQFQGAVDLQQQLAEVQAVSGAAAATLGQLRDAAQEAAEATGITTEEVAGGLGELARAGFDATQAIAALTPTLDLAQSGGIGLSEAVTILTTTLTQFGLGAEDAGRVADVLAKAANASQTSVQGLGLSLSYAAPLARQLGLTLEETTSIIAALGDEGFRGERAGTALRNVFSALLDPSSKFREELDRLGIKGNDFGSILEQLALKGEAGKNALLALDSEARPAIASLFLKGGASVDKFVAALEGAQGSAAETAAIIRDTVGNSVERLAETFDNAFADLIDPVLKPLQGQIESLAGSIKAFAASPEFAQLQEGLKGAFEQGLAAAQKYAAGVDYGELARDTTEFVTAIGSLAEQLGALTEAFSTVKSLADTGLGLDLMDEAALSLARGLNSLTEWLRDVSGSAKELDTDVRTAAAGQTQLSDAVAASRGAFQAIATAMDQVAKKFGLFGQQSEQQAQDASKVSDAFKTLGVDAQNAGIEVTDSGAKMIAALESVVGAANVSSDGIRAAFYKAVDSAQTVTEVGKMEAAFRSAFEAGRISAQEYAAGALQAAQKIIEIKTAAETASHAFSGIGDSAELQTKRVIAAMEGARAAVEETAGALQIKLQAAIKAGAAPEAVEQLRAELRAAKADVEEFNARILAAKESLKSSGDTGKESFDKVAEGATKAGGAAEQVGAQAAAGAAETRTAIGGVLGQLVLMFQKFSAISPAAAQLFKELYNGSVQTALSLGGVAKAIARAEKETDAAIANQRAAAEELSRQYKEVAESGEAAGLAFERATQAGSNGLRQFAEDARAGRGQLELLNQAELDELAASAEQAAAKVAGIQQAAIDATAELAQLNRSLQDELDQRAGNEAAVLERQYQDQLAKINELAARAGEAGRAQADEARRRAEQDYAEELARVQAETKAKAQAAAEQANTNIAEAEREVQAREAINRQNGANQQTGAARSGPVRIELVVRNEQKAGSVLTQISESDLNDLAEAIVGIIGNNFDLT